MAANLVRFASPAGPRWGVVRGTGVVPLAGDFPTTAALIEYGESDWRNAQAAPIALDTLEFLSPVTTPCRIFCQGANYRQHMIESGLDPDAKTFNMFFTKSDASIAPAVGTVRPPPHVLLLDYEIELALVFRRSIQSPVTVTRETVEGLRLCRRDRQRHQRPRCADSTDAVLQGQELSRLLSDRTVAHGS